MLIKQLEKQTSLINIFKTIIPKVCTGHPVIEDHEGAGKELIPVFRSFLI